MCTPHIFRFNLFRFKLPSTIFDDVAHFVVFNFYFHQIRNKQLLSKSKEKLFAHNFCIIKSQDVRLEYQRVYEHNRMFGCK